LNQADFLILRVLLVFEDAALGCREPSPEATRGRSSFWRHLSISFFIIYPPSVRQQDPSARFDTRNRGFDTKAVCL